MIRTSLIGVGTMHVSCVYKVCIQSNLIWLLLLLGRAFAEERADAPPTLEIRETIAGAYESRASFAFIGNDVVVLPRADRSTVEIFDVATGRRMAYLWLSQVRDARRLGESKRVALVGRQVSIVDIERNEVSVLTPQERWHTSGFTGPATDAAGNILAVGVLAGNDEGNVLVWNTESHVLLHTLTGHSEGVMSVALSGNGQHLISSDFGGDVWLWDLHTGGRITKLRTGRGGQGTGLGNLVGTAEAAPCVRFSPSNGNVAVLINAPLDKSWIEVWRPAKDGIVDEWALTGRLDPPSNELLAYDMEFSSDGRVLAVGAQVGDGIVFDIESGTAVARFMHSKAGAKTQSIEFLPNGKVLATGGTDGAIMLWDVSRLR